MGLNIWGNYQKRISLLSIVLGLTVLTSCKTGNAPDIAENTNAVTDSIKASDLIEWKDLGDTLKIVTTADIGRFPFGKLPLKLRMSEYFEGYVFMRTGAKRFYVQKDSSKIEIYEDPELNVAQIIQGKIYDPDLMFVNNFHVGTSAKEVLTYFRIRSTENHSKYAVIVVETGVMGMTHFYHLHNAKIQSITFTTDYVFPNEKEWPW